MELKVIFSMDEKTIDCVDRLAGALAGIKNLGEVNVPLVTQEKTESAPQDKLGTEIPQEPIPEGTPVTETPQEPTPETATRVYTRDEISRSAAAFAKGEGKREELQKLLKEKFGVTGIMNLDESKYGEFAAVLREMGADI